MGDKDAFKNQLRLRKINDKLEVYDVVRRKWLILQPEEWVRQQLVHKLITECGYRTTMLSLEGKVAGSSRRYDIKALASDGEVHLLVECKRPDQPLKDDHIMQALAYAQLEGARYMCITNGESICCFLLEDGKSTKLSELPKF